ncbi:hypothetical protein RIF29_35375 [Crotalaria pallida]|uniref:Uncharacterized protein n=1 Tax=Crotalaria pallida TaxID=3830 RepID=A0AAN9EC45_CROPI
MAMSPLAGHVCAFGELLPPTRLRLSRCSPRVSVASETLWDDTWRLPPLVRFTLSSGHLIGKCRLGSRRRECVSPWTIPGVGALSSHTLGRLVSRCQGTVKALMRAIQGQEWKRLRRLKKWTLILKGCPWIAS